MGPLFVFVASFVMVFFTALIFAGVLIGTVLALAHLVDWIVVSGWNTADRDVTAENRLADDWRL